MGYYLIKSEQGYREFVVDEFGSGWKGTTREKIREVHGWPPSYPCLAYITSSGGNDPEEYGIQFPDRVVNFITRNLIAKERLELEELERYLDERALLPKKRKKKSWEIVG